MLFLVIFLTNFSYSQKIIESKLDSLFSDYNSKTTGVSVAVIKNGTIIFNKGYGMANLEYNIPIKPNTVFNIGSVSKQFTAFSIYLLEKQGKLSLEDDIRKYIPELSDFGNKITIKHLCYHTSGLRDLVFLLPLAGWNLDDVITQKQAIKIISNQKELNFKPGSQFSYSNTGYILLAEIIKRVTNQSFAEYTKENIFQPLGMNETQFYDDYTKIIHNRAYSYQLENGEYKKVVSSSSYVGSTNLFTTVLDLSKWVSNFENPIVGDVELIKEFNQPALLDNGERSVLTVIDGETIYHAKGQFFRDYKGLRLYNHTGGHAGFMSYLVRFPEKRFSVILLSNDASFDRLGKGLAIADLYLKDDLKYRKPYEKVITNKNEDTVKPLNLNLTEFIGNYISDELSISYQIKLKDNKLIILNNRMDDIRLTETNKDTFSGSIYFPIELEFTRNIKNKEIIGFRISNYRAKNIKFKKK